MFFNLFSRMSMLLQINDTKTALKLVLFCGNFATDLGLALEKKGLSKPY